MKLPKINFNFFEMIENWAEMEWTFSYTDVLEILIFSKREQRKSAVGNMNLKK